MISLKLAKIAILTMNTLAKSTSTPTSKLENKQVVLISKSKNKLMPLTELKNQANILGEVTKVRKRLDGQGRQKTPQAVAVARRNARERNRVKQVNNGFAALRLHIPEEITAAFICENVGTKTVNPLTDGGRGASKKLSKVDILRLAVEYIRRLEFILSHGSDGSVLSSKIEERRCLPATPPPESEEALYSTTRPASSLNDETSLSSTIETQIVIINGQQYVQIPGTNAFQLLTSTHNFYENEENIKPFIQANEISTTDNTFDDSSSYLSVEISQNTPALSLYSSGPAVSPAGKIDVQADFDGVKRISENFQSDEMEVDSTTKVEPQDNKKFGSCSSNSTNQVLEAINWWQQQRTIVIKNEPSP